ncbi:transglycosylase domain-containing protein [Nocardiopsis sp. CC223A]|uniref:transglycosylase domain-containing protein n=1 Tax=Nocardiopsis sp. CC223A TaxID=3044051 RepID=UPI00278BF1D9|nr:transglycosylase domain-containing protein [Nocardiopsis sp. CC223A]
MPDVICHGGGELSESTNGASGADGQRPEQDEDVAPETNDTSTEELPDAGEDTTGGAPSTGGGEGAGSASDSGPITFKTSGTLFRERVAQALAEQGFDSAAREDAEASGKAAAAAAPEVTGTSVADESETAAAEVERDASDEDTVREPGMRSSGGEDGAAAQAAPEPAADSWFTPKASKAPKESKASDPGDGTVAADDTAAKTTEGGAPEAPSRTPAAPPVPPVGSAPDPTPAAGPSWAPAAPPVAPAASEVPQAAAESVQGPAATEESAAEAGAMWPRPQRLSNYVGGSGGGRPPQGPGGPTGPAGPAGTGPGKAKKKGKRKKPLWWRILRTFLVASALMVIIACGAFAYFYTTVEVPDAAKADALEQGSTFYFGDGETEFAYRGTDRDPITYEEMTQNGDQVVEAVISAEDRGFWTEPGVSVRGTTRAVWSTVTGQQVQGGSTITQQMVRNYYEGVSFEQTVARKIQEIIISIKVDQSETKEWVMEQYLNTIYFGRQAYGIQAAAQAYYDKDANELTPEEAAFLAAAIQQPTPFGEADVNTTPEMEQRWRYVVDGMVTTGAITQSEADGMEFPAPVEYEPGAGNDLSGYRGYMYEAAMRELEELGYTEDQINRQGFTVVTTFDRDMMDAAYEVVEAAIPQEAIPEGVNIGMATVDNATGEVLAFYGGHDYLENQYDSALLGGAQAGSAFKPYVLATALEEGYSLNSFVDGSGPRQIQGARIQNAGNSAGGPMDLIQATRVSNNLGYVELNMEVGYENVRDTAYDIGLREGSIEDHQLVPTLALGVSTVRPIDQAGAYATFANGGRHVDSHVIKSILNADGEEVRPEVESRQAVKESTAADVTYALEQVVQGGTGTSANFWTHPVAGKTGTTTDSVAAWFVGYTPQLSTAVGVYNENNQRFSIPGYDISGGGVAAPIWRDYMQRAMEGYEREEFPEPAFAGSTQYWAPDPSTQAPEEPVEELPGETPEDPGTPEIPEVPEVPEVPEDPGTPQDPEVPEFPGTGDEDDGSGGEVPPGREEGRVFPSD